MKKLILIAFAACMLVSNPSQAGFIMKKHAAPVENVTAGSDAAVVAAPVATNESSTVVTQSKEVVKKQSFLKRVFNKVKEGGAEISKGLYIVLAIIGFGWLAMGINDNFEGSDWIIGLLLTLLFWLPGLIFALVKMKKYY